MPDVAFISLYTGVGGLDAGFEAAGFKMHVGIDSDPDAVATNRLNGKPVKLRDVNDVPADPSLGGLSRLERTQPKLLVGGPPCQPFSKAGRWKTGTTGGFRDPRATTITHYFRIVGAVLPDVWVLENVEGLSAPNSIDYMLSLVEGVNARSGTRYSPTWTVLDASDYGVPQRRRRLFMVAAADGREFAFPSGTHAARPLDGQKPLATAWDAIGDLVGNVDTDLKPTGKWADLLPTIPEGENYSWHTNRKGGLPIFGWRTRYWTFLLKLAKGKPSWTLSASPGPATGPFHWKNRLLSVRELARLQTLPDTFEFHGDRRSAQKQIGNAVPGLLAEVLARSIREQYFHEKPKGGPKLAVAARADIPVPEAVELVPDKYLELVGEHADHPGPGMGPGRVGTA